MIKHFTSYSLLPHNTFGMNVKTAHFVEFTTSEDVVSIAKELGDICWYIAEAATAIGYSLEDIMQMNIDKLRKRYPEGFSAERSINRESGDI